MDDSRIFLKALANSNDIAEREMNLSGISGAEAMVADFTRIRMSQSAHRLILKSK